MRAKKRYVLLEADRDLTVADVEKATTYFGQRHVKLTMIRPRGNGAALIAKTDIDGAAEIRESSSGLVIGGKKLRTSLTSGSIGKLKRRATRGGTN